jgi:hypothetical protein
MGQTLELDLSFAKHLLLLAVQKTIDVPAREVRKVLHEKHFHAFIAFFASLHLGHDEALECLRFCQNLA